MSTVQDALRARVDRRSVSAALPTIAPYGGLVILLALWMSQQTGVLSLVNVNIQSAAALTLALAATGQTIVVLLGGIDLSIAGVISVTTAILATRSMGDSVPELVFWLVVVSLIGVFCGVVNGLLITVLGLQPLVVTLATWSVFSGVALLILPSDGGEIPPSLTSPLSDSILGLAPAVWVFILLALFALWFNRTRLGTSIRAIGSDKTSAFLSGVKVGRTTVCAYVLSSFFGVLAGVFLASQTASGSPTAGDPYILTSLAAVVVGGTALSGGRGGSGGSLVGALVLTIIASVVFAFNISSFWTPLLLGALLILSVLGSSYANTFAGRNAR